MSNLVERIIGAASTRDPPATKVFVNLEEYLEQGWQGRCCRVPVWWEMGDRRTIDAHPDPSVPYGRVRLPPVPDVEEFARALWQEWWARNQPFAGLRAWFPNQYDEAACRRYGLTP